MTDDTVSITSRRVARRAALINGAVMLALPLIAFVIVAPHLSGDSDTSATVYASGRSEFSRTIQSLIFAMAAVLPCAAVAIWRTSVHVARWMASGTADWRGVREACGIGFLAAFIPLLPASVMSPLQALPYLIVYGGFAMVVGLVVGFVLRTTALLVLRVSQ